MSPFFSGKRLVVGLAIILSSGIMVSCSKNEEPETTPVQPDVPTTPTTSTTDQFSNSTWALTSISGWGKDAFSDYSGMQLRFGTNGSVTEWYSASESYTGSYTISGSTLTFKSLPFTNEWGATYPFTVSGNRLTITSGKGTNMATDLIFTKR
ncbi:MAG: META domain-containing protein [Bacteroides sp.]|nr:META domain-containing protein [Bacteroides sp.]